MMRKNYEHIKIIVGVFVITFAIGVFFTFPFLRTADADKSTSKIAVVEKANVTAKVDYKEEPTVYDVENLWKDAEKNVNRNLLETGEITNGEDIKAKSGEVWLGMFRENDEFVLRPKTVKVVNEWTGWTNISVKGKRNLYFW